MKLSDSLTDHNGDIDSVQLLGIAAFVFFIIFTAYTVYQSKTFDPLTYCTGAGLLIAGVGGAYRMKSGQTPESK
jgi:hypothetical protein